MATRRAIDVNGAKGPIDWRAVARDGITVAFVKASEGTSFVDPRVAANVRGARGAGLHVAPYHFARPDNGNASGKEAEHFLSVIDGLPFDMVPVLDIEQGTGNLSSWALDFLARVSNRYRVPALLYTYSAFAAATLHNAQLAAFPLWLARYSSTPGNPPAPWTHITVWQFTSSGTIAGVPGRCDVSQLHDDDLAALLLGQEEGDDMTDEERTMLREVHTMLSKLTEGVPAYGVEAAPVALSFTHRTVDNIARKLGATVADSHNPLGT